MQETARQSSQSAPRIRVGIKGLHSLPLVTTALAFLMILTFLGGCPTGSPPTSPPRRPNFILIMVDTLRLDRLHYAGYPKDLSPNFDWLQQQSTSFSSAYAPSSWTLPSTASLFLGQPASKHRVVAWGSSLSQTQTTFVEKLREAGYRTAAWSASPLIVKNRGFAQGFDEYHLVRHSQWRRDIPPESRFAFASASEVSSKALAWLREASTADPDAPFFVYLHYMEPHTPLLCAHKAGDECRLAAAVMTRKLLRQQWEFTSSEKELIHDLYDVGVVNMDAAIGHLYRQLSASGLLDQTWLIVTADHGEMLGEQGFYMHGDTLYEPSLRVPLLISSPLRERSVVDSPVSLIDLGPTILDLAGIDPLLSFSGRSLRKALEGGTLPTRPVVSELFQIQKEPKATHRHVLAVTDGATKIVVGVDGKIERFDLKADPEEVDPAYAEHAEIDEFLSEVGISFDSSDVPSEAAREVSPEMRQQLRALGYLE